MKPFYQVTINLSYLDTVLFISECNAIIQIEERFMQYMVPYIQFTYIMTDLTYNHREEPADPKVLESIFQGCKMRFPMIDDCPDPKVLERGSQVP